MSDFEAKPRGGTNTMKVERAIADLREVEHRSAELYVQAGALMRTARQVAVDLQSLLPKREASVEAEQPSKEASATEAQGTLG